VSAKVFALVLDYPFSHTQKAVMLALANQCNDFGQHCFPSFDLIQRHTSLGRRTIFDALAQLEDSGFLTRLPLKNTQRVEFRLHVERLQQTNLPGIEPEDPAGRRAKPTGAGAAPVRQPHQCGSRTGAAHSETGAGAAPTGAGAALHKAPSSYPTAPLLSARARDEEILNEPSGNSEQFVQPTTTVVDLRKGLIAGGYPAHRMPASDPRLDAAAAEGCTAALAESVAQEAMGQSPPKSLGWILAAIRGRLADATTTPVPRGTHATSSPRSSESAVDRQLRRAREIQERTGVDLGVG